MSEPSLSTTVQVVNTLANLVSTLAARMFLPILTYLTVKQNRKAKDVAVQVEQVKIALAGRGERTDKKLTDIHTLVNSNMSVQLRISAVALRRLADLTRDAGDEAAAALAESGYHEHEAKQRIVDQDKKIES